MLSSAIPASFPIPFAANASGAFIRPIPVNSQIGIQDGAASLNDGFVPENMTQIAAGGVPPFGQDMNGILNQVSAWCRWVKAGGPIYNDTTFSAAVGGYPQGAILQSGVLLGRQWYSVSDNNLTNPDDPATSAGWVAIGIPSGMPLPLLTQSVPSGFLAMNGLTIGSAASNATLLAREDTKFLYVFNWPNSNLPILTSGGSVTTRGANAMADFNANKQLTMPNAKGLGMIGCDNMGGSASTFLTGVPFTTGSQTVPGSILGENLHTLSTLELAAHAHANFLSDPTHLHNGASTISMQGTVAGYLANVSSAVAPGSNNGAPFTASLTNLTTVAASTGVTLSNANAGGNVSHNTVERNMTCYWVQRQ